MDSRSGDRPGRSLIIRCRIVRPDPRPSSIFIVPGLYLAVALVFAQVTVALEDAGITEAFERSWRLIAGDRLRLFALAVFVAIVAMATSNVTFISASVLFGGQAVIWEAVSAGLNGIMSMLSATVLIDAYRQLADGPDTPSSGTDDDVSDAAGVSSDADELSTA